VIGSAVLVVGLLLIGSWLASARIPGGATFAPSGIDRSPEHGDDGAGGLFAFARRARSPIRAFALSPIHPATWYANAAIALGSVIGVGGFAIIASIASLGFTTLLAGIGLAFLALGIEGSRLIARMERRRAFVGESARPMAHPYRPLRGGVLAILRAEFADESRWRDVLYVAVNLPLSIMEILVVGTVWMATLSTLTTPIWYDATAGATLPWFLGPLSSHETPFVIARIVVGAALLPVAASLSQLVIALHRAVVAGLLCTSESRELRRRVESLTRSRSAVLDVEASELHRIERDLHDGAQQRLVMLTIDLGLASERIETDPVAAKELILEGQAEARRALAEIRQLVRGIAPSILLDRGLIAALESISGRGPVSTVLVSNLAPGERLPAATERTAYFIVSEALANVAKHSAAQRCEVRCHRDGSLLVVEVWDDGAGGARVEPGGGLEGLASRIAGVDGTLSVSSPRGGPTLVRAEIPVAGTGTTEAGPRGADAPGAGAPGAGAPGTGAPGTGAPEV
jgi:signal transduction histidine kinase